MNFSTPVRSALNALILQALTGLKNQNWAQSYDDGHGTCMYQGPNGRRCFVGQLIPKTILNRLTDAQNEEGIIGLMGSHPKLWDKWFPEISMTSEDKYYVVELFRRLQATHDSSASGDSAEAMRLAYQTVLADEGFYTPEIAAVLA